MNLLSAAAKVSSLTMLSRITGLLRETLIARNFGASEWTDAFNVAFRLPNLLRRLFAEGAFSQAFVPILGEISSNGDQKQAQILVNAVATLLFWALLLTVLLGVIGAPVLILVIATGFSGSPAFEASVVMTRIMFPYIGLIFTGIAFCRNSQYLWPFCDSSLHPRFAQPRFNWERHLIGTASRATDLRSKHWRTFRWLLAIGDSNSGTLAPRTFAANRFITRRH
jgi:murein biosynthesis integral membrane protein MurJ